MFKHAACSLALAASSLAGTIGGADVTVEFVTFVDPPRGGITAIEFDESDPDAMYISQRDGIVQVLVDGTPVPGSPLLDISTEIDTLLEGGLLGMAMHPDFAQNHLIYVIFTTTQNGPIESVIDEFDVSPGGAPTRRRIATFNSFATFHKGGWLGFSPTDGYLYFSIGDDGSEFNAQDLTLAHGKIHRIDPSSDAFPADVNNNYAIPADNPFVGTGNLETIWHFGLRNPYRCAFDSETGDLIIGDVGRGDREEVNHVPNGTAGLNFGWPCREGTLKRLSGCGDDLTDPLYEYQTGSIGFSVIGGPVYRGCAIPEIVGRTFFGDAFGNFLSSFVAVNGVATDIVAGNDAPISGGLICFGEDTFGELYMGDLNGFIRKLTPAVAPPDTDGDGIPDSCEAGLCLGDCDASGAVNFADLVTMLFLFGQNPGDACDADDSGNIDFADLVATLFAFGPCD